MRDSELAVYCTNWGRRAACSTSAFPHSDHPADIPGGSELGHKPTFCTAPKMPLFDHLVRGCEQ